MRLTKEELSVAYPCNNHVLLRPLLDVNQVQTKSGAKLFVDTTYKPEHHSRVICEVVSVPKQLIFSRKHKEYSMEWKCDMMLRVGDKVIINYLAGLDAEKYYHFTVDGEKIFLVPYERIYMIIGKKTMMINGYMLIEREKAPKRSRYEVFDKEEERIGVVRFMDEPNQQYLYDWEYDDDITHVGDRVVMAYTHYKTLEDPLHRVFDPEKEYLVVQRKQIAAVLDKKKKFPLVLGE